MPKSGPGLLAGLIEQKLLPLVSETWVASHHEIMQLRNWLELLPVEVVHARPQLCLASSLLLLMIASYPKLDGWLDVAETTLCAALGPQTDENDPSSMSMQKDRLGTVLGARAALRRYLTPITIRRPEPDGRACADLPRV